VKKRDAYQLRVIFEKIGQLIKQSLHIMAWVYNLSDSEMVGGNFGMVGILAFLYKEKRFPIRRMKKILIARRYKFCI